ncbi:hypothetical protein NSP73_24245, partial [Salmonella enterica]|nr:hypothetical protein [Salmonella enterica]
MKSRECKAAEADRKFFKVSAGIDWLDLKISLSRLTQHGTVAKLAMRQPFVLFKGLTFQKLCLP